MKYRSVRGFKDILPEEIGLWQKFESVSRDIFKKFNYLEIRTPILEETGLFKKSVGEDTDIVNKEMFSFVDRGERDISLRPEGTAPIIRAYLENSLYKTEPFQKLYYIGPMFRAERPQAGRLRQFHQIGIEAIGSDRPAIDAEVINVMTKTLDACGIKGYQLKLNNLGCRQDKSRLASILKDIFSQKGVVKILCEDCQRRLITNPLRVLDCKNENCRNIVRTNFKNVEFLCGDCKAHFDEVEGFLKLLKIPYTIDRFIVRGLDYYTRTVFEVSHEDLGSQDAVGAGGRYDNLTSDMGGPRVGACGFALGLDRMILAYGRRELGDKKIEKNEGIDLFIASIGGTAFKKAFLLLDELRSASISCDIDYEDSSLKSQMRSADKLGAKFVLILGDDEIKKGEAVLRDMKTKEQVNIDFKNIARSIIEKIG